MPVGPRLVLRIAELDATCGRVLERCTAGGSHSRSPVVRSRDDSACTELVGRGRREQSVVHTLAEAARERSEHWST